MSRTWIAGLVLAALITVPGCAPDRVVSEPESSEPPPPATVSTETPVEEQPTASIAWLDTPLTDAVTGKEFRLSDFKGKPILLHAFATW